MNNLQSWIVSNPVAAFPSIAIHFLIVSIGGWYMGNLIQWLRNKSSTL